jgi:hypothetical protein
MSVESSVELNQIKQISPSFHQFEEAHREEITALSLIVAKITSRAIEEVKPRLDIMLSELVEGKTPLFDSQQWEADMRLLAEGADIVPVLSDEAFTRESIYGNHD